MLAGRRSRLGLDPKDSGIQRRCRDGNDGGAGEPRNRRDLRAHDVIHRFFILRCASSRTRYRSCDHMHFTPIETEDYEILCAELCGLRSLQNARHVRSSVRKSSTNGCGTGGREAITWLLTISPAQETPPTRAPQGFIRKWVFSWTIKSSASSITSGAGRVFVGMFLSLLMRIHLVAPTGLPFWRHQAGDVSHAGDHARHHHGFLCAHHRATGGFGNYFCRFRLVRRTWLPVLNMLSFWTTFLGFIVMLAAFFVAGGAPLHGWTGYAPLSALQSAGPGEGLRVGFVDYQHRFFCIGALMGALNFITTTLDMRAKGMTMMPCRSPFGPGSSPRFWGFSRSVCCSLPGFCC